MYIVGHEYTCDIDCCGLETLYLSIYRKLILIKINHICDNLHLEFLILKYDFIKVLNKNKNKTSQHRGWKHFARYINSGGEYIEFVNNDGFFLSIKRFWWKLQCI